MADGRYRLMRIDKTYDGAGDKQFEETCVRSHEKLSDALINQPFNHFWVEDTESGLQFVPTWRPTFLAGYSDTEALAHAG